MSTQRLICTWVNCTTFGQCIKIRRRAPPLRRIGEPQEASSKKRGFPAQEARQAELPCGDKGGNRGHLWVVVQSLSFQLSSTPWTAACQAFQFFTIFQSLLKVMSIESVMSSNHVILCCPLLLLPSIFPSIRVFSNESALSIRWPKYWSFSFSISPSSEHPGLISFRMDCLDLLAAQGTLKSLLQHHSSEASILQHSAFFMVQFSHLYMTTGETIALARWTFISKVKFLLFNMLSRFVIAFLPRSKCLLISWLH